MPYNTRAIIRDGNGAPIPQLYNPATDQYEPLQGSAATGPRTVLYGPDGNPLTVTGSKLAVRASEIESILGEVSAAPTPNTLADRLKQVADRIGAQTDGEATGDGSLIAVVKRLRTVLTDVWSDPDNALLVRTVRRFDAIKTAPVVGVKTVTTTAAEIFAGASRLSGRYAMVVYNEGAQPVYWGGSSVTTSNGFPLLPQDTVVYAFDPTVATAIYMVAAANTTVRVVELA